MAKRARPGHEVSSEPAAGLSRRAVLTVLVIAAIGLVLLAAFVLGGEGEGVAPGEQTGDPLPVEAEGEGGS